MTLKSMTCIATAAALTACGGGSSTPTQTSTAAAVVATPAVVAPVVTPAPVVVSPVVTPAPVVVAPVVTPAPVVVAPIVTPAPVVVAPVVAPAPVVVTPAPIVTPVVTPTPAPAVVATVSGTVVKGPIGGALVCAYEISSTGGRGPQVGQCTSTDRDGGYKLNLPKEGPVIIESTGGSFTDEATGKEMGLTSPMRVGVSAKGNVVGQITPLTTIAVSIAQAASGGATLANFETAALSVSKMFGLPAGTDIVTLVALVGPNPNSYGRAVVAASYYTRDSAPLETLTSWANTGAKLSPIVANYIKAWKLANPGQITVDFRFAAFNGEVLATDSSGGLNISTATSSCGIRLDATTKVAGVTSPATLELCVDEPASACNTAGTSWVEKSATVQNFYKTLESSPKYSFYGSCSSSAVKLSKVGLSVF